MAGYAMTGAYYPNNRMGVNPYQNPYYIQKMRQAAADSDLNDKIDCLQDAIINNRSIRIERVYDDLKTTLMNMPQYQFSFKDENGNINESQLRQAIIKIYNARAKETTGKTLDEAIASSQSSNFGTGYWNAIIPLFRDKSQSEVTRIIHNREFDHSTGDKAAQVTGSVFGAATLAVGLGIIAKCVIGGSTAGPVGAAIGAIAGIGIALWNACAK